MKLAPPRPEPTEAETEPDLTSGRRGTGAPADAHARFGPARRTRSRTVVLLKGVAILLAVAGVLALVDGVLTLVWQEPISSLLAHFDQARLAQNLKRLEAERATPAQERALASLPTDDQRMAYFARQLQQTARAGQAIGRIRIPRIGANFVVVAGTDEASLKKGPGLYSGTSVPGLRGTVGIAGHRTTYLAPFRRINELAKGDRVTVEMPYGFFTYSVLGHRIVAPNDVSVLRQTPYDQVVLTACNPLYSAAQRIVVFARLTAAVPTGLALSSLPAAASAPPIPLAAMAGAVLGAAGSGAAGPLSPPPPIGPDEVLVGTRAGAPAPTAPPRPARRPVHPARSRATPRATPSRPASPVGTAPAAPSPVSSHPPVPASPRAPVHVTPPTPGPVFVPKPAPPVAKQPVVKAPPPAPAPAPVVAAPPAASQQTRVQGSPGGPQPIIGGPSG